MRISRPMSVFAIAVVVAGPAFAGERIETWSGGWPSPTARNLTIDGQRLLEIPAVSGRTRASRRSNVLLQAHRESSPGRPRLSFSASNRRVPGSLESYASQLPSLANVNGIGKQDDNGRSVC